MIRVEHTEHIERSPLFVYTAGVDTSTWPDLEKLTLEARTAVLAHNTDIEAAIDELGQHIEVPCRVTELDPGRRLAFEGESDKAWLALCLNLAERDGAAATTEVHARLDLEIRSRMLRFTLGKVAAHVAQSHIKNFATGFRSNVDALPLDHFGELKDLAS